MEHRGSHHIPFSERPTVERGGTAPERVPLPSVSDILSQKAQLGEHARGRKKSKVYHREQQRLGNDLAKLYLEGSSHDRLLLDLYAAETQPVSVIWTDWGRDIAPHRIRRFLAKVAPLSEEALEEELGKALEVREKKREELAGYRRRYYNERMRQRSVQTQPHEPTQVYPQPEH